VIDFDWPNFPAKRLQASDLPSCKTSHKKQEEEEPAKPATMEHLFSRTVYRQASIRRHPNYSVTKEIAMMASLDAKNEKAARERAQQRSSRATSSWTNAWMPSVLNNTEGMLSSMMLSNLVNNTSIIYSRKP